MSSTKFIFSDAFFQDPASFSYSIYKYKDIYTYNNGQCDIKTFDSALSYYWHKLADPKKASLTDISQQLNFSVNGVNQYIKDSPDLYATGLINRLSEIKEYDELNQKLDFFKRHITQLNQEFIATNKTKEGYLYRLVLTIVNFVRKIFGYRSISLEPIQTIKDEEINQFINNLKNLWNAKLLRVTSAIPALDIDEINNELRLLSFNQKDQCQIKINDQDTLSIQVITHEGSRKKQYSFQTDSSSDETYFLSYHDKQDDKNLYRQLSKAEWLQLPSDIQQFSICKSIGVEMIGSFPLSEGKEVLVFEVR